MKLTKSKLKQLIKEELRKALHESFDEKEFQTCVQQIITKDYTGTNFQKKYDATMSCCTEYWKRTGRSTHETYDQNVADCKYVRCIQIIKGTSGYQKADASGKKERMQRCRRWHP